MAKTSTGLSEPAYMHILNLIMSKKLMPGDKIPETKIAQEFNISRTPVRDAMRLLSNDGLIDIFPNRFAQVKTYSNEDIAEIGTLRIALDTMAIKLAALYGSRADFLRLEELAQACTDAFEKGESDQRRAFDSQFHLELANIAGNELLIKYQKELYLRVQFILLHHPNIIEDEIYHIKQHHEIAQALLNGKEQTALAVVVEHLTSFYNLKEKYPEEFFQHML